MRTIKPPPHPPRLLRWFLLAGADAWVITRQRPEVGRLWGHLRHPHQWVAETGADRAVATVAGAALWLAAVWLGLALIACLSARLPGPIGRTARRAVVLAIPRTLRRVELGAAAVSIVLTPANAGATPGNNSAGTAHPAVPIAASVSAAGESPPEATPPATALQAQPAIRWPSDDDPRQQTPPARATSSAPASISSAADITVEPGDSLWLIAQRHTARHSAAETAAAWPRWYQANRRVIGDDPGLLLPGTRLSTPKPGH